MNENTRSDTLHFKVLSYESNYTLQGCAMAFGFCASNNLDAVLLKLEQITKNEMVPKSSGFLGLMKVIVSATRKSL